LTSISASLLSRFAEFFDWPWEKIEPYYTALAGRTLTEQTLPAWLEDWSNLRRMVDERYARLQLAQAKNTSDRQVEKRYSSFIEKVYPHIQAAEHTLRVKLLESGLSLPGMENSLRQMRAEVNLHRTENLPLIAEEHRRGIDYTRISGAQTVEQEGGKTSLAELMARLRSPQREEREQVWRLMLQRQMQDRQALNQLWQELLIIRRQIATNAGFPNYRSFRWQQLLRFDYTPEDCLRFHEAVEAAAVPAASRIYTRLCEEMGTSSVRPWDLDQDLYPAAFEVELPPYSSEEMLSLAASIFQNIDPRLGAHFETIRQSRSCDIEIRPGKAPGAFCTSFAVGRMPYIFMNAAGTSADLHTLLHESGHAFHILERSKLPYHQQWRTGMEFAEAAALTVELLASSAAAELAGADTKRRALRAHQAHLEKMILFWPYIAVVDAFQHWAYTHPDLAARSENCDACWAELWDRFIPGVDWEGLDQEKQTGWQRKLHIFRYPFYYLEYGIAQLAAVQIWERALTRPEEAISAFIKALSLGGTEPLPSLYRTAGAEFSFTRENLAAAVGFLEEKIAEAADAA
jgi:oligoendopeptidase F